MSAIWVQYECNLSTIEYNVSAMCVQCECNVSAMWVWCECNLSAMSAVSLVSASNMSAMSALKWNLPTGKWVHLNHKGKRGRMLWNDKEKYTSTKILAFCVQKRRGPYFLQCSRVHKAVHERHIRALGAQRWKRVAAAQCETFSSSTRKWLKFKTVENSIQLTMWFHALHEKR